MDLKYELTKHPAIRHTVDGGGPLYIHHQKKPKNWLSGKPLFVLAGGIVITSTREILTLITG